MNILVIAPTPYFSDRGCHIRIYEEAAALQRAGHNPIIYTYHIGKDAGNIAVERIKKVNWYKKTAAGPAWAKLYLDWLLFWKILKTYKTHEPDVIHAHLHEGAFIGYWLKKFIKVPLVLDAQGSLVGEVETYGFFKTLGMKKLFQKIEWWIVNHVDYIFTSSKASFDLIKQNSSKQQEKITLLGDSVSLTNFDSDSESLKRLRVELNISENHPVVIYSGGLSKIKGIDLFLYAIPQVLSKMPDTQFLIIGYPEIQRCEQVANQLGISKSIKFTGRVDYFELLTYLHLADIAVDPKPVGAGEASGKILNYMAAGLPCVAFESENTKDILDDTGLLVKNETSEDLASGIITLLSNSDQRTELGKNAKARIKNKFLWDKKIKDAINVYETLTK